MHPQRRLMERIAKPLRQLLRQRLHIAVILHGVRIEIASQHEWLPKLLRRIHSMRPPGAAFRRIRAGIVGHVLGHRDHQLAGTRIFLRQLLENLLLHEEHIHHGQHPASFSGSQHISLADRHVDFQRDNLWLSEEGMPVLRRLLVEIGTHDRICILRLSRSERVPGEDG